MIAVIFPGQGSQKPGMGKELFETRPEAKEVFRQVEEATGVDTQTLCFDMDEDLLRQTQNAQLALYTVGVSAYRCLYAHFRGIVTIGAFSGHSVGEYAALAASESVSVAEGARLVQERGRLMSRAPEGTMAAVLGMNLSELDAICHSTPGTVVIANDNCPGQLVISGELESVRFACERAMERGAKRVLPLNVSGAFHSPLMETSAEEFAEFLKPFIFQGGGRVFSNVLAQPVVQPGRWPDLLSQQLRSRVRWTETIENMLNEGVTTFIECGVGDVLSGLIKRISKETKTYRVQDTNSLEATISELRS
jgi:[acyl-carrier-protein] S-malonyltransferase